MKLKNLIVVLLLLTAFNPIPEKKVSGSVSDENNQPLSGVLVKLKGSKYSTNTDSSGKFSISIPTISKTLEFSFIGYKPQVVKIPENGILHVKMVPDIHGLEEVVVTAYGSGKQKRSFEAFPVQTYSASPLFDQSSYQVHNTENYNAINENSFGKRPPRPA